MGQSAPFVNHEAEPEARPDTPEDLQRELSSARRQAEEYADLLRQTRADLAEYRRRAERERAEQASQARLGLLLRVLPILEEFERALAVPAKERRKAAWQAGIESIERKLRGVLESEGLERIEAEGALYNPWEHEAIRAEASPELEDQRILEVVRDGYRIGDRVIRPAQVVVGRRGR
jgi:molecular chaperone GrpE